MKGLTRKSPIASREMLGYVTLLIQLYPLYFPMHMFVNIISLLSGQGKWVTRYASRGAHIR